MKGKDGRVESSQVSSGWSRLIQCTDMGWRCLGEARNGAVFVAGWAEVIHSLLLIWIMHYHALMIN